MLSLLKCTFQQFLRCKQAQENRVWMKKNNSQFWAFLLKIRGIQMKLFKWHVWSSNWVRLHVLILAWASILLKCCTYGLWHKIAIFFTKTEATEQWQFWNWPKWLNLNLVFAYIQSVRICYSSIIERVEQI